MTGRERVEVWQQDDDAWRWQYVGTGPDGEPLEIPSNRPEPSREAAVAAAQVAYPDLPVDPPEPAPGEGRSGARGHRRLLLAVVVVAVAAWRMRRARRRPHP